MRGSLYVYCAHGADCPDRAKRGHVKHGYRVDLAVGPDGKRRQQRQGGYARKADAQRALSVALAELASGVHQARSALTVAGRRVFVTLWIPKRAPVVGRVAMQICTVDVTDIPGVSVGDVVTLPARRITASARLIRLYEDQFA